VNLFVLDRAISKAAAKHCDVHVVKMCLETAQIVCSALYPRVMPYKATHLHHPCVVWAAETVGNFVWALDLGYALCEEYKGRYGKEHASLEVLDVCARTRHPRNSISMTPFALAMPVQYKRGDAVLSYREYYMSKMENVRDEHLRMRRYHRQKLSLEKIKRLIAE